MSLATLVLDIGRNNVELLVMDKTGAILDVQAMKQVPRTQPHCFHYATTPASYGVTMLPVH